MSREEHTRNHETDGFWHDDCLGCLERRYTGKSPIAPAVPVGVQPEACGSGQCRQCSGDEMLPECPFRAAAAVGVQPAERAEDPALAKAMVAARLAVIGSQQRHPIYEEELTTIVTAVVAALREDLRVLVAAIEDDPDIHDDRCTRFYEGSDDCSCLIGPVTDLLREHLAAGRE